MKFDAGRFLIKNADSGNLAVLPDTNHGTELVGAIPGLNENLKGEKWNIVSLSTKKLNKYKIQNCDFASFASCDNGPDPGYNVLGKTAPRQWAIKETSRAGHYIICTGHDPELFWGLPDDEDGTPIELSDKANDPHNQWTFERVGDLDDCVREITGDNRAQCLKALNNFPSLAAAQLDVSIQEGGLAAVVKLLSHSDTIIQSTASTTLTTLAFTVFPLITIDLYEWKSASSKTRALQKMIDFAIADQIKAAAVDSYMVPQLVRLLGSEEDTIVCKSLEALTALMSIPAARMAAYEAQVGPVLQQLVASEPATKDAAQAALALVGAADPASPPVPTIPSPEIFPPQHPSSTPFVDSPEAANRKPKRSNTLNCPHEPDAAPSAPGGQNEDPSIGFTSEGTVLFDRRDLGSASTGHDSITTPGTHISNPGGTTVPTYASISSLVAFLQGESFATRGAAARRLRNAIQDNATAQNLAFASGAVPALAKILVADSSDTLVVGYAIEALTNIVALNDEAKASAVQSGVLPSLIQSLYNPIVCGEAAMALRILSRNALAQVNIEAAGAVPALVRLLEEREEVTTRINAAGALSNISMNESVKQVVWEAGPFPHLLRMLNSPDASLHPMSTAALWSLSRHVKARADIGIHVSRFVELLGSDQPMVRANAAGVLSNICAETNLKEAAIKAGAIPALAQLTQSTEDISTLNNGVSSLWALAVLSTVQTTIALSGCVPTLVKFLESGDARLRSNSAITLWYIANSMEGKSGIVDAGGVPPLVRLLSDKDKLVQCRAAELGCLPPLIKLVESDHIPSRMPAAAALWQVFTEEEAQRMGIELNAIAPLLRLMNNTEMDWATRTKAAGALKTISLPPDGKIKLAAAGGIQDLITCLDPVHSPEETTSAKADATPDIVREEDKANKEREKEIGRNNFVLHVCGVMWNVTTPSENQIQALALGAVPKLLPLLHHSSLEICGQAVGALGNIACTWDAKAASRGALPALTDLLQLGNEHIDVKAQAARCLANITGDPAAKCYATPALPGLIVLLQSNNAAAMNQAAMAIKSIVDDSDAKSVARANGAVEVLQQLLNRHAGDTNRELRGNLKSALSSMAKRNFWF